EMHRRLMEGAKDLSPEQLKDLEKQIQEKVHEAINPERMKQIQDQIDQAVKQAADPERMKQIQKQIDKAMKDAFNPERMKQLEQHIRSAIDQERGQGAGRGRGAPQPPGGADRRDLEKRMERLERKMDQVLEALEASGKTPKR